MEVLITGTNTQVMWERQPRTREVKLGVEVKMVSAAAALRYLTKLTAVTLVYLQLPEKKKNLFTDNFATENKIQYFVEFVSI